MILTMLALSQMIRDSKRTEEQLMMIVIIVTMMMMLMMLTMYNVNDQRLDGNRGTA